MCRAYDRVRFHQQLNILGSTQSYKNIRASQFEGTPGACFLAGSPSFEQWLTQRPHDHLLFIVEPSTKTRTQTLSRPLTSFFSFLSTSNWFDLCDLSGSRGRRMRWRCLSASDFIGPLGVIFDAAGHESSDALLMRRWKEGKCAKRFGHRIQSGTRERGMWTRRSELLIQRLSVRGEKNNRTYFLPFGHWT